MKKLIVVRHAKSSWQNMNQADFDRPLNERGNRDAPVMAKKLLAREPGIDAFIASPAKRALTTAFYFAKAYGVQETDVLQVPRLYHASSSMFYEVISTLDDAWQTVVLFSHNPGITAFVNELTQVRIDNMPTCGVFATAIEVNNWKDIQDADKRFLFFDYPKMDL